MSEIKRPVFFSGENPGMTLYVPGTEQAVAVASYWNCTDSPHGVGHVLVLWLDTKAAPVPDIGQGHIFTDNLELAQILVRDLTQYFSEFRDVPIQKLTHANAQCGHTFDGACYRVVCQTPQAKIELEWAEVLDRKQIIWPEFPAGEAVYDLSTVICPCRTGRIRLNGKSITGEAQTVQREDGTFASTAFLAFAETWIGPRDRT